MGDFLPQVGHDQVCGIYELKEAKFMKESVGFLLVSVENRGFLSLCYDLALKSGCFQGYWATDIPKAELRVV